MGATGGMFANKKEKLFKIKRNSWACISKNRIVIYAPLAFLKKKVLKSFLKHFVFLIDTL